MKQEESESDCDEDEGEVLTLQKLHDRIEREENKSKIKDFALKCKNCGFGSLAKDFLVDIELVGVKKHFEEYFRCPKCESSLVGLHPKFEASNTLMMI